MSSKRSVQPMMMSRTCGRASKSWTGRISSVGIIAGRCGFLPPNIARSSSSAIFPSQSIVFGGLDLRGSLPSVLIYGCWPWAALLSFLSLFFGRSSAINVCLHVRQQRESKVPQITVIITQPNTRHHVLLKALFCRRIRLPGKCRLHNISPFLPWRSGAEWLPEIGWSTPWTYIPKHGF